MAQFRYQAVNRNGKSLRGMIEASTRTAASAELSKQGLYLLKLESYEKQNRLFRGGAGLSSRVKLSELVPFCRQFATLVRAGVTLNKSLEVLTAQTENRTLKSALQDVQQEIQQGISLKEAFSAHTRVFPEIFVNMVGAGEYSGQLEKMLERLAVFFERQHATSQKLVSALTYPIAVLFITVVVTVFLLTSVVPSLAKTFAEQGMELPLPTRIVLGTSHFLLDQWYLAVGLGGLILVMFLAIMRSETGRLVWDTWRLRLPVFGKLYKNGLMARFARTFSTMEASAIPILENLELLKRIVNNKLFTVAMTEAQRDLQKGEPISQTLAHYPLLFPPIVVQMVAIGEETGEIESLLTNLADFYETHVIEMSARLSSLLEPLMILFLAGIVGMIIFSVYLPMFTMMNFVQ